MPAWWTKTRHGVAGYSFLAGPSTNSNSQYESMLIEGPDRGCQGYGGGPTGWSATLENALGQAGVVRLFDSMSAARIHN